MGNAHHAGHVALHGLGDSQHAAEIVETAHRVAGFDATGLGVFHAHEHRVAEGLLSPGHVVVAGVGAAHVVRRVGLQRVGALLLGLPVGERLLVAAARHEVVRVGLDGFVVKPDAVHIVGLVLAVDLQLAGHRRARPGGVGHDDRLAVFANAQLVITVAHVVARIALRALHHVASVGHELVEGDLALLGRVARVVLLVVGLGPGDDRLPLRGVLIQHAHAEEVAEPLIVVALRVGVIRVVPHALDDLAEDALLLAGLVHRLHQGFPSEQGVLALLLAVAVAEGARPGQLAPTLVVVALPVGAHRQDNVGELGRERELDLEGHAGVGGAHHLDGRGQVAARLHKVRVRLHEQARVHRHLAGLMVDRRVGAQLRRIAHHVAGAEVVGAFRGGQILAVGQRAPPGIALDIAVGARGGGAAHQVVHVAVVAADVLDEPIARVARVPSVDGRRTVAALAEVPA